MFLFRVTVLGKVNTTPPHGEDRAFAPISQEIDVDVFYPIGTTSYHTQYALSV